MKIRKVKGVWVARVRVGKTHVEFVSRVSFVDAMLCAVHGVYGPKMRGSK